MNSVGAQMGHNKVSWQIYLDFNKYINKEKFTFNKYINIFANMLCFTFPLTALYLPLVNENFQTLLENDIAHDTLRKARMS